MNKLATGLVALIALGTAGDAMAEGRRTNGLEKDVAVRHRRLLVKGRFELAPLFESTMNADFRHIIGGGLKLEYHLSDMFSVGAVGVAATAINTKLVDRIGPTLPDSPDPMMPREPTKDQFLQRLNSIPFHGAAYVSITPWYGKLAAFSQAYVAFDFYFQAGVALAVLKSDCPTNVCTDDTQGVSMDGNPNNDSPLNAGFRAGLYLGGGIHVFLNDFIALDLTVRDYAFSDNPSGADFNADSFVGDNDVLGDDNRFIHHLFFGVGLSIMFPTAVKRTP
ncbi:MAG: outer membrane beta-barrel domain-containing protein [Deltaproteobacteria bacterium]|nr:outer membrane beta-barrel domain-containing protein [Deltaproteobacteria bacterium]